MASFDHDVIIVGSGPAGSSAALHLAKYAPSLLPRTLVLERARHPREKLCAGGLVSDTVHILRRLGLDLREIPTVKAPWLHLLFEGRGARLRMFDDHAFSIVRRHELDAWLAGKARAAGAMIEEETPVQSVEKIDGGVQVVTPRGTLRARAVIGADGSAGVVRRLVAPRTGSGVGRTLEVLTAPTRAGLPSPQCALDDAIMEFGELARGYPGYSWSFPALEKGEPRRTFGTYDSRLPGAPSRGPLQDILAPEMQRHGHRLSDYPLAGHPLRWFVPRAPLAAPHVLLAGDAAGADPLFGEGISLALGYGDHAAQALSRAFQSGDFSFSTYTGDIHKSRMGRALLARWAAAQAIYRLPSVRARRALIHHGEKAIQAFCERVLFNWAK